jgi:hypothetical protein
VTKQEKNEFYKDKIRGVGHKQGRIKTNQRKLRNRGKISYEKKS